MVCHLILLHGSIVTWIKGLNAVCTVNGLTSSQLPITYGVPQGSILGSLLFLLYVNDLQEWLVHQHVYLYADDTVIYSTENDVK